MVGDLFTTQRDASDALPALLAAAGFEQAQQIGRGGFGIVYRCVQVELDRVVAVKVLVADLEDNRPRFLREQQAMARLTGHPNIVPVLQVGRTASGHPFLVMPYYEQDCLQKRICQAGVLGLEEVLHIGVRIAGALESAHRLEILHRDVKPANILLTHYGEPALTDFGIAHLTGGFKTTTGVFTGSPAYTAPEVLSGQPATAASDVYGLGATMFTALTGHAAFERHQGEQVVAQFVRITTEPLPDLRKHGMPADVAGVVAQTMARDPNRRPTALELGERLQQLQARHGVTVDEMVLQGGGGHAAFRQPAGQPSASPRAGRLPVPMAGFVGREAELARLGELLRDSRLVTVTGIGGVGKTALAATAAAESAADFLGGAWWVDLSEVSEGDLLANAVGAALGLPEQPGRPVVNVVLEFLVARHALLVLDRCERVVGEAAKLVETLLQLCPRLHILATSCEPLDVGGEAVLALRTLGHYRLDQPIGRGDTGEVYRAYDTRTDRIVALKVLPGHLADDATFEQRFRRASQAAAGINEPHVVPIHGFGEINGRLYLDMRLIEGRTLATIISNRAGPLDAAFSVAIVEQAASALDAAHAVGLIHRDIKPSKFLVTDRDFLYVVDFGLARIAGEASLTSRNSLGGMAYTAPERFDGGKADAHSDIYSLTCVLYECLTGVPPYPADSLEQQISGHLGLPAPRPSTVDPSLAPFDDVIAKGLAKKPADRYRSAGELAVTARRALESQVRAVVPRPPRPAPRIGWPARRRLAVLAAVVLLAVVGVVGAWQWRGHWAGRGESASTNASGGSGQGTALAPGGAAESLAAMLPADIKAAGKLVIGLEVPYAPLEFKNSEGQLDGFEVDLMDAVARTLDLVPEYRETAFASIIPAVQVGGLNVGLASFTDTLKREQLVDFVTFFEAGTLWAQRPGPRIDPNAACGRKVGVAAGGLQDTDEVPRKSAVCVAAGLPPIEKVVFPTQDDLTAALIGGQVDAMSADSPVTGFAIKLSAGMLVPAGDVFDSAPYGWPVAKGSGLAESLRQAVAHLMQTGEYRTIATMWGLEQGMIDKPEINGATA